MFEHIEPYEARQAVENATDGLLDVAIYRLMNEHHLSIEEVIDALHDEPVDDTNAISMSLDQQVRFLENHIDDVGLELTDLSLDDLRLRIESMSCLVIHSLAMQVATELLENLSEFLEDNDLEKDTISDSNQFGWAVHRSERCEGEDCTVYEYRNVEGTDVDVWHFMRGQWNLYFTQQIDEGDESPTEELDE